MQVAFFSVVLDRAWLGCPGIWVGTSRIWKNFMQENSGLIFRSLGFVQLKGAQFLLQAHRFSLRGALVPLTGPPFPLRSLLNCLIVGHSPRVLVAHFHGVSLRDSLEYRSWPDLKLPNFLRTFPTLTPRCPGVERFLHPLGPRKMHFLVRRSMIFGADVHDPKGSRKTLSRKGVHLFSGP